jgi:hypothetical protein
MRCRPCLWAAIARKLLVAANAMIKQDKLWQKNDTD